MQTQTTSANATVLLSGDDDETVLWEVTARVRVGVEDEEIADGDEPIAFDADADGDADEPHEPQYDEYVETFHVVVGSSQITDAVEHLKAHQRAFVNKLGYDEDAHFQVISVIRVETPLFIVTSSALH